MLIQHLAPTATPQTLQQGDTPERRGWSFQQPPFCCRELPSTLNAAQALWSLSCLHSLWEGVEHAHHDGCSAAEKLLLNAVSCPRCRTRMGKR